MTELPIACSLDASGYEQRRSEWRDLITQALRDQITTETGVRLTFTATPDVERRLTALVAAERDCCAFATWTVTHQNNALILLVNSQGEGAAAVRELFAAV
jgi:hypothetical protein